MSIEKYDEPTFIKYLAHLLFGNNSDKQAAKNLFGFIFFAISSIAPSSKV